MISVLIPVFNYNVTSLVKNIHNQLINSELKFEILFLEDGSDSGYIKQNQELNNLTNTTQIHSKTNLGRIKARQLLSDKSKYNWILFLDADVIPKANTFISTYINLLHLKNEVVFGGFAYYLEKPNKDYRLRWTYGKNNEEVPSSIRNKKPYKVIISANFLIKKNIFNSINSSINGKGYGFDNYFGSLLKVNKIKILHIDNEVYHLGIETNSCYLQKKEAAAKTLLRLYKLNKLNNHDNDLLRFFLKLKTYKLNFLFAVFYYLFKNILRKNILSRKPSIKVLQLYIISYLCYIDLK